MKSDSDDDFQKAIVKLGIFLVDTLMLWFLLPRIFPYLVWLKMDFWHYLGIVWCIRVIGYNWNLNFIDDHKT